jgi:tripartite-type tricarboxylate transporter receptor subunit TctC
MILQRALRQSQASRAFRFGATTKDRSETMPEVPPIGDTLAGFETSSFYGVGAPCGTPRPIVDLLNKEINAALADPLITQRFAKLGAIPIVVDPGQFGATLAVETERWRKVAELSGQKRSETGRIDFGVAHMHRSRYAA